MQIQAVTSVGAGNFSSPVIVELAGISETEPKSSSVVGIVVAVIAIFIIVLSIVGVFLIVCICYMVSGCYAMVFLSMHSKPTNAFACNMCLINVSINVCVCAKKAKVLYNI